MDTIEALQPLIRVFQLLGMSIVEFPTFKHIPFHRVIKYYSLLLIASRFSIFCYIMTNSHIFANSKLNFTIDRAILSFSHFVEMSTLLEAFVKARQEEMFLGNLREIDDILTHNFNVDLKMNKLRRSAVKRLIIWMCGIGVNCSLILFAHYNEYYFASIIIWMMSIFTESLTYFQIVTWTELIHFRLCIVNKLLNGLNNGQSEEIERQNIDNSSIRAKESAGASDDTYVFDKIYVLCDLYNRLWIQTNRLNERFKFSMVLNIAYNFTWLVVLLYYIFMGFEKVEICVFYGTNITACIICTFHLSMLSMAGQNMADEGLQIAYTIHRNKFIRSSTKLNVFVRVNCYSYSKEYS